MLKSLLLLWLIAAPIFSQSACDLNNDGKVDSTDVQLAKGMAVGTSPCTSVILGPGVCNAVVVQRVINTAMGKPCVTAGNPRTVTLTWVASASPNVAGYTVFRSTTPGGPYTQIISAIVAATSYQDKTVLAGLAYYFVVTAVDKSGISSSYSSEAKAIVPFP